mmetsp:Transcript_28910/g.67299  ORF Transcript_28910/g.67299 Transcript_28910/m.67299 type:complete len:210 (+) Transcript_28910:1284-1913(+)
MCYSPQWSAVLNNHLSSGIAMGISDLTMFSLWSGPHLSCTPRCEWHASTPGTTRLLLGGCHSHALEVNPPRRRTSTVWLRILMISRKIHGGRSEQWPLRHRWGLTTIATIGGGICSPTISRQGFHQILHSARPCRSCFAAGRLRVICSEGGALGCQVPLEPAQVTLTGERRQRSRVVICLTELLHRFGDGLEHVPYRIIRAVSFRLSPF